MNIYFIAFVIVVVNLLVSTCVLRDKHRSRQEKTLETVLIWLLPILGALQSMCISCRDPQRAKEFEDIEKSFNSLR